MMACTGEAVSLPQQDRKMHGIAGVGGHILAYGIGIGFIS